MRSGATTLWVADHHLLQTHTTALRESAEGQGTEAGRHLQDQLRRARPGYAQLLSLPAAQRGLAGLPLFARHRRGGHLDPGRTRMDHLLLQSLPRPGDRLHALRRRRARRRRLRLLFGRGRHPSRQDLGRRPHAAEGHRRPQSDAQGPQGRPAGRGDRADKGRQGQKLEGWDDKKGKYVKIFKVKADPKEDDELDFNEFDNIIRAVETAAVEHAGWVMKKGKEWVRQPAVNVKIAAAKPGAPEDRGRRDHGRGRGAWLAAGQPALPRRVPRRPAMEFQCRPIQVQARRTGR